jgi:hypothetical protein
MDDYLVKSRGLSTGDFDLNCNQARWLTFARLFPTLLVLS